MRTVILNTLDAAFAKKDVFYRAFAPDQIVWIEQGLDGLQNAAAQIGLLQRQEMIRQDYHLVVLIDLEHFQYSEFADVREVLKRVVVAQLNDRLMPLLEQEDLLPACSTILFTYFRDRKDTEKGRELYTLLLRADPEKPLTELSLAYKRRGTPGERLDLSDMLQEILNDDSYRPEEPRPQPAPVDPLSALSDDEAEPEPAPEQDEAEPEPHRVDPLLAMVTKLRNAPKARKEEKESTVARRTEHLEGMLQKRFDELQAYQTAADPDHPLTPATCELPFRMKEPSLANADLQINLSRMIYELSQSQSDPAAAAGAFRVRPHDETELTAILANAEASIRRYRYTAGRQDYFELTEPYRSEETGEVELAIRDSLRKVGDVVPGVREAVDVLEKSPVGGSDDAEREADKGKTELSRQVRASWFLISREKRRFRELYRKLRDQYDRKKVREDQEKILDICAGQFLTWRSEKRKNRRDGKLKPTLEKRPVIEEQRRKALVEARERCAEGVLERFDDFSDVREQGAELHTEFRALTRFWSPDRQTKNHSLFLRFAFGMALLFVLLMILPFILIENRETGAKLPKILLYVLYYGSFLALYAVGMLHWMRALCKKLHTLSNRLEDLLYHSADRRRQSILKAVETYGRLLPECLLQQMNLDAIERTDEQNAALEQLQLLHLGYLNDAMIEVQNLRTAMRLPELPTGTAKQVTIRFDQAPYAPCNQAAYLLFHEEGGKR